MGGTFQPLAKQFPIVDDSGQPTEYFIRWAQQRQIDIGEGISGSEAEKIVQDWAKTHSVLAGNGLSGGGTLDDDVTLSLDATLGDLNDVDLSTPPEDKQVLVWDKGAAKWVPSDQSGGGGGSGGGPATMLYNWVHAVNGNLPNVPIVVDVSNYDTCQVIISQVAKASNTSFQVNFSTDGGVTFDTATVYRVDISSTGAPGFNDPALYQSGASTAARTYGWSFLNLRANAPVIIQGQRQGIYDRALPVTHVRIAVNAVATSGQIYVMGK